MVCTEGTTVQTPLRGVCKACMRVGEGGRAGRRASKEPCAGMVRVACTHARLRSCRHGVLQPAAGRSSDAGHAARAACARAQPGLPLTGTCPAHRHAGGRKGLGHAGGRRLEHSNEARGNLHRPAREGSLLQSQSSSACIRGSAGSLRMHHAPHAAAAQPAGCIRGTEAMPTSLCRPQLGPRSATAG